ncbi:hypothetical protein MTO96_033158 [Rhipicephalus appendiculatus]
MTNATLEGEAYPGKMTCIQNEPHETQSSRIAWTWSIRYLDVRLGSCSILDVGTIFNSRSKILLRLPDMKYGFASPETVCLGRRVSFHSLHRPVWTARTDE